MRRSDRKIKERQDLLDVIRRCDVCRLALNDDGYPYIVPLNFGVVTKGDEIELVFHSALEGHKLDLVRADNRASFEMDCSHQLQYFEEKGYCTYSYESVTGRGHIEFVAEEEKAAALQVLMDHYHPDRNASFNPSAIPRTAVYKLKVESISGKRKELKK
ncbi:MAG: pyridoxamine 5'-phosphate oxidase family protein [Firmicutes bacterium]|nr:pyridoxamine 5'-phosphate oxidase family protein [Bacillota bacterium]